MEKICQNNLVYLFRLILPVKKIHSVWHTSKKYDITIGKFGRMSIYYLEKDSI